MVAAIASGESLATEVDQALLRCRRIGCRTQAAAAGAVLPAGAWRSCSGCDAVRSDACSPVPQGPDARGSAGK